MGLIGERESIHCAGLDRRPLLESVGIHRDRQFGTALPFCLAHLIRDVKFLTTLADARDRAYGERLLGGLRSLFAVIHRREDLSERDFQSQLEAARDQVLRLGTHDVPATRACLNLAKRFEAHGESYFRFHHDSGCGTDEQPGGTGDPVRGDRSPDHAGDAERARQPLVRTDLDGVGDVPSTGAIGLRVSGGGRVGVVSGG